LTDVMIKNRTSALVNPLKEYSVQKRIDTWKGILITSWYFPLGKGQNTTGYAHSYYLQVLGEIGYPGLILFLSILAMGLYRGMKVIRHSRDKDLAEFARLLVTIIFVISILNLTGTHLHTPPGDVFFWFSLGCISRFYRRMQAERRAPPGGGGEPPGLRGVAHPSSASDRSAHLEGAGPGPYLSHQGTASDPCRRSRPASPGRAGFGTQLALRLDRLGASAAAHQARPHLLLGRTLVSGHMAGRASGPRPGSSHGFLFGGKPPQIPSLALHPPVARGLYILSGRHRAHARNRRAVALLGVPRRNNRDPPVDSARK